MKQPLSILIGLFAFILTAFPALAQFDTRATAAYVIDHTTGTVLMAKQSDVPLPPASMSKLMTVYMTFEALRDGRLTMDTRLPVSQHSMDYTGSTMFLNTSDRVSVSDLLHGVIILSGNDASSVLAEALSPDGSEAGFAKIMTQRATKLGMTNSTFANSNGWPDPGQRMSVHDLAILANRIITDFPEYYPIFAQTEFLFDGRAPQNKSNRNPLLKLGIGADGLKTGHTKEAGYGLVGSAIQGKRRVVFVITGLSSAGERATEAERIVNWAFRQFALKTLVPAGETVTHADIWMGRAKQVGLTVNQDLTLLLPTLIQSDITANVVYDGPINAPVTKGKELAKLVIKRGNLPDMIVPLYADSDVEAGGFLTRFRTSAKILIGKALNGIQGLL